MSVADSTSAAAVQMQNLIRDFVAVGYDEQQIRGYFIDKYGEWIVLDPAASGMNLLIYLVPGLGFGFGIGWAAYVVLGWRKDPDQVAVADESGMPKDRYEQRLLEQLEE